MEAAFFSSIQEIPPDTWQGLFTGDYPFTRWAFLAHLEAQGCLGPERGWQPQHLLLSEQGQARAAMPLYLKTHSYGEYVFDWGWAEAYQRQGLDYYPKLLNAIPFTPASGPRLAVLGEQNLWPALEQALEQRCKALKASSWHSLFACGPQGWSGTVVQRLGVQFHWFNQNYNDFAHFLSHCQSRKRKTLRREREKAQGSGLEIKCLHSHQITPAHWLAFYQLYQNTYAKRSGRPGYLTPGFFTGLSQVLPGQVYLVGAFDGEQLVAGALFFADQHCLYGRYWGSLGEWDALHFECCYYQGIDLAIALNLQRFDPGAQGEHKIARGFTPVYTQSFHHLQHPGFQDAVADFCQREARQLNHYRQECFNALPFHDQHPSPDAEILLR
jgi:uncharacterized protein